MDGVAFARFHEPFVRILEQRHHEAIALVPVAILGQHQRLIDQPGKQLEHAPLFHRLAAAHTFCGLQCPASREHRQATEQELLRVRQQVVTPIDRRKQRLVPRQRGPAAAGQQIQAIVQTIRDLLDRQHLHT